MHTATKFVVVLPMYGYVLGASIVSWKTPVKQLYEIGRLISSILNEPGIMLLSPLHRQLTFNGRTDHHHHAFILLQLLLLYPAHTKEIE